jgi:hypothetical protein
VGGALALLLAAGEASEARARAETARRLGRIARALRAYADAHDGKLPPAATYGPDGLPRHSWRVLILPYLGQADLHRRFRLDEPWDSPHNLALLPRMPAVYAPPDWASTRAPPGTTFWQVLAGQGSAFPRGMELYLPRDFPAGLSNTILVVEAGDPVPWTEPADVAFPLTQPTPLGGVTRARGKLNLLGARRVRGLHIVFADGKVGFINRPDPEGEVNGRGHLCQEPLGGNW